MDNLKFIQLYALQKADDEPLEMRERIYRALAATAPSAVDTNRLTKLADELQMIQRATDQLLLDLRNAE